MKAATMNTGNAPLRRNASRQSLARLHVGRFNKGSSSRLQKLGNNRKGVNPNEELVNPLEGAEPAPTSNDAPLNTAATATTNNNSNNTNNNHTTTTNTGDKPLETENSPPETPRSRRIASQRGKPNSSFGSTVNLFGSALGSHRYRGLSAPGSLNGQGHQHHVKHGNNNGHSRRAIMQLETEEDSSDKSRDFVDYDDDNSNDNLELQPPQSSMDQLSIGLQPVEPTPPKMSDETVISVTNVANMASALKGARDKARFVNETDLNSSAVNVSRNLVDMSQMLNGWNTESKRKSLASLAISHHAPTQRSNEKPSLVNSVYRTKDPRAFEKVFREYVNTRAISNPVANSLQRIALQVPALSPQFLQHELESTQSHNHHLPQKFRLPSAANALVATTAHEISDFSERGQSLANIYEGTRHFPASDNDFNSTLEQIWSGEWVGRVTTDANQEQEQDKYTNARSNETTQSGLQDIDEQAAPFRPAAAYDSGSSQTWKTLPNQKPNYDGRARDSQATIKLM